MAAGMLKETREAWPALGFHERFEQIICMVMAVLIALEFKHSIPGVLERKRHVIQVQAVVLIALLALVRRFIILEATKTGPMTLIGLASAALALGGIYWLVREQDHRQAREQVEAE